jgi:hypothetical protein
MRAFLLIACIARGTAFWLINGRFAPRSVLVSHFVFINNNFAHPNVLK